MKTRRAISTISFNSPVYLRVVLDRLAESGVIEYAHWVAHLPEADEKKAHLHLFIQPSHVVDTSALRREFEEPDPVENVPRGTLPFTPSKFQDWYLYGIHDPSYLESKGLSRQHIYTADDVKSTCADLLNEQASTIDQLKFKTAFHLRRMSAQFASWDDVMLSGVVPIPQYTYWQAYYQALCCKRSETRQQKTLDSNPAPVVD